VVEDQVEIAVFVRQRRQAPALDRLQSRIIVPKPDDRLAIDIAAVQLLLVEIDRKLGQNPATSAAPFEDPGHVRDMHAHTR